MTYVADFKGNPKDTQDRPNTRLWDYERRYIWRYTSSHVGNIFPMNYTQIYFFHDNNAFNKSGMFTIMFLIHKYVFLYFSVNYNITN